MMVTMLLIAIKLCTCQTCSAHPLTEFSAQLHSTAEPDEDTEVQRREMNPHPTSPTACR